MTNAQLTLLLAKMDAIIAASVTMPIGSIISYGGAVTPSGYLPCDGAAVNRTTYANLFTAIGTAWGAGDGATTFNVPDLRGRSPVGVGTGAGLTARALAATGGEETHQLSAAELAAHAHNITDPGHIHAATVTDPGHTHTVNVREGAAVLGHASPAGFDQPPDNSVPFAALSSTTGVAVGITGNSTGVTVDSAGGDGSHNTMHPFAAVAFAIKT